ncbi:MAG: lysophospholipase [Actinomycetota bacterium]
MTDLILDERFGATRTGTTQLRRRWRPAESEGGGPPRSAILIVHGIGEHSGRYLHVGRFLAERGHDVAAFDARGHGQTGGRRGYVERFDEFLDDVEDALAERRELGVPVVLLGHSLGGLISSTYVVSDRPPPDLLILSAPSLHAVVPRWQRVAAPALSRLAPRLFIASDFDPSILMADPEVQQTFVDDPLRLGGATTRLGNEIFQAMAATNARLDRITMPTYVLHGDADQLVPPAASAPLAELPSVTYRLWPGLRHECFNEANHGEVLAEMEDWLSARLADHGEGDDAGAAPADEAAPTDD